MTSSRWWGGGGQVKNGQNSDGSGSLQGRRERGATEIRCLEL